MEKRDVLHEISEKMPELSKGHKKIAAYILNNYEKAAYMTAGRLGRAAGVSESTVVRFAGELGCDGYPELKALLAETSRNRLTALQRMEVTSERLGGADVLAAVLTQDMENIRKTLDGTSREDFSAAVGAVCRAENIYVIGVRSSSALAGFLSYYLNLIFGQVQYITASGESGVFEKLLPMRENDLLIGIGFPRYSSQTVQAMRFAKNSGAEVLAITDTKGSPLARIADYTLAARSDMASFADSLVAPMSLINALIVAVGNRRKDQVSENLNRLEGIWEEYNVYEKEEH